MAHPGVVGNRKGEGVPLHVVVITKDAIDDAESRFQVRISLVASGSNHGVPA